MRVGLPGLTPDSLTGDQFRGALGFADLRSTAFSLERVGDRLRFEGRGYGHGVGMCVVGAGRRAQRGETAEQILAHYFPALTRPALRRPGALTAAWLSAARPPAGRCRSMPRAA